MGHRDYDDGISRDFDVAGANVTADCGSSCGTVWFNSVPACRALLRHLGKVPRGQDVGLCDICACRYSVIERGNKSYPEFVCRKYKEGLTKLADDILRKNPDSGRPGIDSMEMSAAEIKEIMRG